ncbi:beta-N-acetylhexosaminidase [Undibacterium danionis]|uniref:beta-N-acetylhexosaminidase n=1 Tax=Undibacterium danionis TaxID=1812100 RepID=A0ABV6ICJ0_9BURK
MSRSVFVLGSALWLGLCQLVFSPQANAATTPNALPIIPLPQKIVSQQGVFKLDSKVKIYAADLASQSNAKLLIAALASTQAWQLTLHQGLPTKMDKNLIVFRTPKDAAITDESYQLNIQANTVELIGSERGQFYALQSLLQLLPLQRQPVVQLPLAQIQDQPRFAWRGMHLDVGRHMFSVEFIKKLLDQMAVYKLNTFHWHLTEDQGWRIEIKRYPKLTEIGGYRKQTTKDRNYQPYIGDGEPYGGYYTQEQIKEVVAYARNKHIDVVPEIELPGHSLAALAAYPELACTPGPFEVGTNWGIFEDIYCPSEQTFTFLENVLTEVIALFPSPYLHIGGDEAPKTRWKASPLAQEVMRREGLKNEEELQSYFIRRVEKFINSKGKRLIGWDEILEGGLAPNATVMSWRGEEGGIAAAKEGHDVIMSPTSWCYFDAGQGPKEQELWQLGGEISMAKVYSYNPVPKILTAAEQSRIRGVQANVWTEYLRTSEKVEYMVFPRILAMAEVAWSAQEQRRFDDFEQRIVTHYPRLSAQKIAYRIPRPQGLDQITVQNDQATLTLKAPVAGSKMYLSLDGSAPDTNVLHYRKPVSFKASPTQPVVVKVLTVLADGRRSAIQQVQVPAVNVSPAK